MRLVLLRHGQSLWNLENRFTGWTDVDLSEKGIREAHEAGKLLKSEGYIFDIAYTSFLKRAIRTLWIVLDNMDLMWIPVEKSWRLNERHYGALQGRSKQVTADKYGIEQVHIWRRSYDVSPPSLTDDDPRHPKHETRYAQLRETELPKTESLKDTLNRTLPYWNDKIAQNLHLGKKVLVSAHGNSLRAIVKYLDSISDNDITELNLNAIVGFWQEHKADNAIELLKQKLAPKAKVLRDGKWIEVDAKELVPGDVVRVRLGVIIPADIKLFDGDYLLTDESALTGESLPVEKHVSEIAYSGSIARQGEMNGLVVATGMNTYFGHTAKLVEEAHTRSHFQKAVIKIGDYLIILALALVAVIFLVALYRHESLVETLQFALILTVAAIPAALPAVLSVTMAVGAMALAKKKAIVSKLVAIEEMAGMDILCSDKTGTITQNKITVGDVNPFELYKENDVLLFAVLASREEDHDPIDDSILDRAKKTGDITETLNSYETVEFAPFDPVSKRAVATIESKDGKIFKVAKGAPQAILSLLIDKEATAPKIEEMVNALALKGYRPLGVARTDDSETWQYAGLIGLYDPPREDSAETIKIAQSMGAKVKMVTGDHTAIAKEIARQVNLGTNIMPASSFLDKPDREAQRIVEEADGFAQVFPEHKYHIVELLQAKGHIVGMTGDGVNDAPALKKADAGIAVAGATDAAKSAADIVLTMPGLSVIIDAIKESRTIFERMNSYAVYRIAETTRVLLFLTLSILIFNFYPVTAVMIVILAILNDAPIMMIAYDNTTISPSPVKWDMRKVLTLATILGMMGVFASFLLFWIGERILHLDRLTIHTLIFLKLAVAGHMTIYLTRTNENPFCTRPFPAAALFFTAEATQVIGTLIAVYGVFMHPIGWKLAGFVWGYALVFFVVNDFIKVRLYRILNHRGLVFHR